MVTMYINAIGQLLAMLIIFLATKYLTYFITEVKGVPKWLDYKPFNCSLCSCFWTLIAIYTTLLIIGYNWAGIGGIILAILNALAMWINQKKKTEKIEDFDEKFKK